MTDDFRTAFNWDDARILLAIAEQRSLSGAARELGVNHATISRRLARLEAAIANPLIERSGTRFALTGAGEAAFLQAQRMGSAAADFARAASATDQLAGIVRVSATPTVAEQFLAGLLGLIVRQHPAIEIELFGEDRNVRLSSGEADLSIRMDRPHSGNARARKLGELHYSVYASPTYLEQTAEGQRRFIGFSSDEASRGAMGSRIAELAHGEALAIRCPSIAAQREAAAAGAGLALLPRFLAADDARLIEVEHTRYRWRQSLWLVMRSDVSRVARVRLVADAIAEELARKLRGGMSTGG
ncbi:MAG TPA: LysR family transcriptional regulator [Sphingomicrobium sp.]|nr:LysR family transcriptional regulator [Sphingomicrobium sp.]